MSTTTITTFSDWKTSVLTTTTATTAKCSAKNSRLTRCHT
jgi:hypothetical protein